MEKPPEENNKNSFRDWKGYYQAIEGAPHTAELEIAVQDFCKEKGEALDVGAGSLRDTKYLLEQDFTVTAIDPSPLSREIGESLANESLRFIPEPIGNFDFPEEQFSLVNAQGILFHFSEPRFSFILDQLKKSLKRGGVFCANFIGTNDDWHQKENKTSLTKEALEQLFPDFDIKILKESEQDESEEFAQKKALYTNNLQYKPKHWHILSLVAVKR